MPDAISFAELERRNRAIARAREVWGMATAVKAANPKAPLAECLATAEDEYAGLLARCIAAEPVSDETEFAFGTGATTGTPGGTD